MEVSVDLLNSLVSTLEANFLMNYFRPLCSAQLAVGCAFGVALWTVDPASLGTRPSASCLTPLPHSTSVNSLCWDPNVRHFSFITF